MTDQNHVRRYYEVQYFWQQPLSWFAWIVCGGAIFMLNRAGVIHSGFAVVMTVFIAGVILLVTFTQLHTEVSDEGIAYKMRPFHRQWRRIPWNEIQTAYVREYKPLREYGGWGVRIGLNGKAYNVKGNQGLQVELVSGQKILIGTQRPEELQSVLDELNL